MKLKNDVFAGVAVGLAKFDGKEDAKKALGRADEAMYKSKNAQKSAQKPKIEIFSAFNPRLNV